MISMAQSGGSEDKPMPTDTQSETRPRSPVEDGEAQRNEWVAAVEQVVSDAEAWATEQKWFVHRDRKTITEDPIGSYEVPVLMIRPPLVASSSSRAAASAAESRGRIDLSSSLRTIMSSSSGPTRDGTSSSIRRPSIALGPRRLSSRSRRTWPRKHDPQAAANGTHPRSQARVPRLSVAAGGWTTLSPIRPHSLPNGSNSRTIGTSG